MSAVLFTLAMVAHNYAANALPRSLKNLAPSLGWFLTSCTIRQRSLVSSLLVLLAQSGAAYFVARQYSPLRHALVCRLFIFPTIATAASVLVGTSIPHINFMCAVAMLGMQLHCMLGGLLLSMCYPASLLQVTFPNGMLEQVYNTFKKTSEITRSRTISRVKVSEGKCEASLDTIIVQPRQYLSRRWVVYLGGNAEFAETTVEGATCLAEALQANLVLFNPRGVGRSSGYVSELNDLVADAKRVTCYLMCKYSVLERELLFFGHSIGGAVAATLVANNFPDASLVLDRTFSRLTDAVVCFSPFPERFTRNVFAFVLGDLDAVTAWNSVRHDRKLIIYSDQDEIIQYDRASIARLPQFATKTGIDADKIIKLHEQNVASKHNCALTMFRENGAINSRMSNFFPIQAVIQPTNSK